MTLAELKADAAEGVGPFQGASAGLLDDADLTDVGAVLRPGSLAGVLVYQNTWAAPFGRALTRPGPAVANGLIPVQVSRRPRGGRGQGLTRPDIGARRLHFPTKTHERTEPCQDFFEEWPGPPWSPVRRPPFPTAFPSTGGPVGEQEQAQLEPQYAPPPPPPAPADAAPPPPADDMQARLEQSARWGRCATRAC